MNAPETIMTNDTDVKQAILSELLQMMGKLLNAAPSMDDIDVGLLEMGANSLTYMEIVRAVGKQFSVKLALNQFFVDLTTIDAIAEYVEEHLPEDSHLLQSNTMTMEQATAPQQAAPVAEPAPQPVAQPVAEQVMAQPVQQPVQQPMQQVQMQQPQPVQPVMQPVQPIQMAAPVQQSQMPVQNLGDNNDINQLMAAQIQGVTQAVSSVVAQQLAFLQANGLAAPAPAAVQPQAQQVQTQQAVPAQPAQSPTPAAQPKAQTKPAAQPAAKKADKGTATLPPWRVQETKSKQLDAQKQAHLEALIERFTKKTGKSKAYTQDGRAKLADNRASAGFRLSTKEMLYPLVGSKSNGSHFWDIDDNKYLDITMGFGVHFFGHDAPFIKKALTDQLEEGMPLGPQAPLATEVAKLICELTGMDRVTICNTGTEAVMTAIRLARAVTGRRKIAAFANSYHGHFDGTLAVREDPSDPFSVVPVAPGICEGAVEDTIVLDYGDPQSFEVLKKHKDEIAAVLVEPVQSRNPGLHPKAFLQQLRQHTKDLGMALIFDEMITGFRIHPGGAQHYFGVEADMAVYGKIVGGGMPIGIVSGRNGFMDALDGGYWQYSDKSFPPSDVTFFAGTFNKHPMVLAASRAVLLQLKEQGPELQAHANRLTERLANELNAWFKQEQVPYEVTYFGSLFRINLTGDSELLYFHLLENGVYIWEGRNCFLSSAHSDEDIDFLVDAVQKSVNALREGGYLSAKKSQTSPCNAEQNTALTTTAAAAKKKDTVGLTPNQQLLWTFNQMGGDWALAYHLQINLKIEGPLAVNHLADALQTVVDRHEALRFVFDSEGQYQLAQKDRQVPLTVVDISEYPVDEQPAQVEAFYHKDNGQSFDLDNGPIIRAHLVKYHDDKHLLAIVAHHLVTDGLSAELMSQELAHIYSANVAGKPHGLPEATQFGDYVRWHEALQITDAMRKHEEFWLSQFSGDIPVLKLPLDRPHPPVKTFRGGREPLPLSPELSSELKNFATSNGFTPFMLYFAAYAIWLHRISGQNELIIGFSVSGRTMDGSDNLVGYCTHLLPIRIDINPDDTLLSFLRDIRARLSLGYEHQEYAPVAQLINRLNLKRDGARPPLIPVIFNLDGLPDPVEMTGLKVERVSQPMRHAAYDISFNMVDIGTNDFLECDYNLDVFEQQTIQRLLNHFEVLLKNLTQCGDRRIGTLPIMSESHRDQLIQGFNQTQADYQWQTTLTELIQAQVSKTPDATALRFFDESLSYAELNAKANQLAAHLKSLGTKANDIIGVCLNRSMEMVISLLAIHKAGAAYLPLDPDAPDERLAYIIDDAKVPVLLSDSIVGERFTDTGVELISVEQLLAGFGDENTEDLPVSSGPQDLAYVIYTSGSTGKPKGVLCTHQGISNRLIWMQQHYQLDGSDSVLQKTPFGFDVSVWEFFWPLMTGATLVMAKPKGHQDPEYLAQTIFDYNITTMHFVPSMLQIFLQTLAQNKQSDYCDSLKRVICSGEALSAKLQSQFFGILPNVDLENLYGPTEASVDVSYWQCEKDSPLNTVPIGRPISNTQLYILDKYLQPVPIGVEGDLYIGGAGLARAYNNRPELTANTFIDNPFAYELAGNQAVKEEHKRLYKTGDLARFISIPGYEGAIEYLGRSDSQIKLRGFRIELGEIDNVLASHPSVQNGHVLDCEGNAGERRLVAFVVCKKDTEQVASNALRDYLKQHLPEYMVPGVFVFLEQMPLSTNGKVDRHALRKMQGQGQHPAGLYVAPRHDIEQKLAQAWQQIFGLTQIGIEDDFFALGGDSIIGLQLVSKARQFNLHLTLKLLFSYPTIASLAEQIKQQEVTQPLAEQGPVSGDISLSPVQQWYLGRRPEPLNHFNQTLMLDIDTDVDATCLQLAVEFLPRHHDILRLRLNAGEDGWTQKILGLEENQSLAYQRVDLSHVTPEQAKTEIESICQKQQEALDIANGPNIRAVHFHLGHNQPGRLFITIHHMAVDAVSWRILMNDVHTGYQQLKAMNYPSSADGLDLPEKTSSYKQWLESLQSYRDGACKKQQDYWLEALQQPVAPLPLNADGDNTQASTAHVTVKLDKAQTEQLLKTSGKAYNTRTTDLLVTALSLALARWSGNDINSVDFEGHGRQELIEGVDVSRTVGWFSAVYPVQLNCQNAHNPIDALKHIKEQLRAIPDDGVGYGVLRYLNPTSQIARQLGAIGHSEILFNYLGQLSIEQGNELFLQASKESYGDLVSAKQMRAYLLEINSWVSDGELTVEWGYSNNKHHDSTIEKVASDFIATLQSIIKQCELESRRHFTPSDFALSGLNQAQLDARLDVLQDVEDLYPLSPMQQGMLFHTQYAEKKGIYMEQYHGVLLDLDQEKWIAAWQTLLERHSVLRTSMLWQDLEQPLQRVHKSVTLDWDIQDWRELDDDTQQNRMAELLVSDRESGFELDKPPLIRGRLIRLSDQKTGFVWNIHHILLDGWSMANLFGELRDIYRALMQAQPAQLPATRPYSDYIRLLKDSDKSVSEQYWQQQLAGFDRPTMLQIDSAYHSKSQDALDKPLAKSAADYRELQQQMPDALGNAIVNLARVHQLTPFSFVQAAWSILLTRYSGDNDVVFGITVSGRPAQLSNVEKMVGLFINTLPARVKLDDQSALLDFLKTLNDSHLERDKYAHTPLVDIQNLSDVPRGTALFDSIIAFENFPIDALSATDEYDIHLQSGDVSIEEVNFPLSVQVMPGEQWTIKISYDNERFNTEVVTRITQQLQTLLGNMVEDLSQPLWQIPMLSNAEQRLLFEEYNQLKPTARLDSTEQPIALLPFVEKVQSAPEAVAIVTNDEALTYDQLETRANQLAHHLQSLGAGPEKLITVYMERTAMLAVALLGVMKSGAAFVPVDPAFPKRRTDYILNDSGSHIVLCDDEFAERFDDFDGHVVSMQKTWPTIAQNAKNSPAFKSTPDNLAYVIYTSGTTGNPKGVQIQGRSLDYFLAKACEQVSMETQDRLLSVTTISFDIFLLEFLLPLRHGATVALLDSDSAKDGKKLLAAIDQHQATVMQATPATWQNLLSVGWQQNSLRKAFSGGEALPLPLAKAICQRVPKLWNLYGPTETTIYSAISQYDSDMLENMDRISIGHALEGSAFYVLDAHMQPLPIGVAGDLYIGGRGLARGYFNRPELTEEKFIANPFSDIPGDKMYATGDRAYVQQDGSLIFLGRSDFQVKLRGFRIELGEIESVMLAHPGVAACAAAVQDDTQGDKRLVSFTTPVLTGNEENAQQNTGTQQLDQWRTVWDDTYRNMSDSDDATFQTAGWQDSLTGDAISDVAMREWLTQTADSILAHKPKRVLEIGCGSGMLIHKIAPSCEHYYACDFSPSALAYVEQTLTQRPELDNVTLVQQQADDPTPIADKPVDMVIINSVIQYFPSLDYLQTVLQNALNQLAPGGRLFIGDVRNGQLQPLFGLAKLQRFIDSSMTCGKLKTRMALELKHEEELVLHPGFFSAWQSNQSGLAGTQIRLKAGNEVTEMNGYRYDVVIEKAADDSQSQQQSEQAPVTWDWQQQGFSLDDITEQLAQNKDEALLLRNLPNARLAKENALNRALQQVQDDEQSADALRNTLAEEAAFHPAELIALAEKAGVKTKTCWSAYSLEGAFDILFYQGESDYRFELEQNGSSADADLTRYSNNPLWEKTCRQLETQLREHLKQHLPHYMRPSNYMFMAQLPLTPNHKVDRKALPLLSQTTELVEQSGDSRLTPSEELLAQIWSGVLNVSIESIGRESDFFELGGHSLLATQVISRIDNTFRVDFPLKAMFDHSSLSQMALAVNDAQSGGKPELVKAPAETAVPLSYAQRRMWFMQQLDKSASALNITSGLKLQGRLNVAALNKSLAELSRRHESLHSYFPVVDDVPVVQSHELEHQLDIVDLTEVSADAQQSALEQVQMDTCQQPFDLENGPLFRSKLVILGPQSHLLYLSIHHIISDGWSNGVLVRELTELYRSYAKDLQSPSPLQPLPLDYRDYSHWQNQCLTQDNRDKQLRYWQNQLADIPPLLELPVKAARTQSTSMACAKETFALSKPLSEALQQLSRRHGVTLFMSLLSAYAIVLSRFSGQDDIVIGTPIANRNQKALEAMVGFFVNTLVMRVDLSDNPCLEKLLSQVRNTALDAYAHQDLPFDQLVDAMQVERDLGHTPLFQVMFVLQNTPQSDFDLPGIDIQELKIGKDMTQLDLTLALEVVDGQLFGEVEYKTALFSADMIADLLLSFESVLNAMANASQNQLPLSQLAQPEPQLIESRVNAQKGEIAAVLNDTIGEQIRLIAEQQPNALAVQFGDTQCSYGELQTKANQLAHWLKQQDADKDTRVGIYLPRSISAIAACVAIWQSGATLVVLDVEHPQKRLNHIIEDANVTIILSEQSVLANLPDFIGQSLCVESCFKEASADLPAIDAEISPDDLAYLIYTSGTTGQPKGVMVSHKNIRNNSHNMARLYGIDTNGKVLQLTPLGFDVAMSDIAMALTTGASLHLTHGDTNLPGVEMMNLLKQQQITHLQILPSVLSQLPHEPLPNLQTIIVGGEACTVGILPYWSKEYRLFNAYGPSETTVCATNYLCTPQDAQRQRVPIGKALTNTSCYVLDAQRNPVAPGMVGELYIGGVGVGLGYLNKPELTDEKFLADPFDHSDNARMYRTFDKVRLLEQGNIEFIGRLDKQVKVRGYRIELGDIESALDSFAAINQAAATVDGSDERYARLIAFYTKQSQVDIEQLQTHLLQSLPSYMVPGEIVEVDTLPRTINGKVDRDKLLQQHKAKDSELAAKNDSESETEKALKAIWSQVLGKAHITKDSHFFKLGGHSLDITRVHSQIRQQFNAEPQLRSLFEHPTLAQMAGLIDGCKQSGSEKKAGIKAVSRKAYRRKKARS